MSLFTCDCGASFFNASKLGGHISNCPKRRRLEPAAPKLRTTGKVTRDFRSGDLCQFTDPSERGRVFRVVGATFPDEGVAVIIHRAAKPFPRIPKNGFVFLQYSDRAVLPLLLRRCKLERTAVVDEDFEPGSSNSNAAGYCCLLRLPVAGFTEESFRAVAGISCAVQAWKQLPSKMRLLPRDVGSSTPIGDADLVLNAPEVSNLRVQFKSSSEASTSDELDSGPGSSSAEDLLHVPDGILLPPNNILSEIRQLRQIDLSIWDAQIDQLSNIALNAIASGEYPEPQARAEFGEHAANVHSLLLNSCSKEQLFDQLIRYSRDNPSFSLADVPQSITRVNFLHAEPPQYVFPLTPGRSLTLRQHLFLALVRRISHPRFKEHMVPLPQQQPTTAAGAHPMSAPKVHRLWQKEPDSTRVAVDIFLPLIIAKDAFSYGWQQESVDNIVMRPLNFDHTCALDTNSWIQVGEVDPCPKTLPRKATRRGGLAPSLLSNTVTVHRAYMVLWRLMRPFFTDAHVVRFPDKRGTAVVKVANGMGYFLCDYYEMQRLTLVWLQGQRPCPHCLVQEQRLAQFYSPQQLSQLRRFVADTLQLSPAQLKQRSTYALPSFFAETSLETDRVLPEVFHMMAGLLGYFAAGLQAILRAVGAEVVVLRMLQRTEASPDGYWLDPAKALCSGIRWEDRPRKMRVLVVLTYGLIPSVDTQVLLHFLNFFRLCSRRDLSDADLQSCLDSRQTFFRLLPKSTFVTSQRSAFRVLKLHQMLHVDLADSGALLYWSMKTVEKLWSKYKPMIPTMKRSTAVRAFTSKIVHKEMAPTVVLHRDHRQPAIATVPLKYRVPAEDEVLRAALRRHLASEGGDVSFVGPELSLTTYQEVRYPDDDTIYAGKVTYRSGVEQLTHSIVQVACTPDNEDFTERVALVEKIIQLPTSPMPLLYVHFLRSVTGFPAHRNPAWTDMTAFGVEALELSGICEVVGPDSLMGLCHLVPHVSIDERTTWSNAASDAVPTLTPTCWFFSPVSLWFTDA